MSFAMTIHTTLEVCEDRFYESTKLASQRIFYERGTPRVLISDQEPSFKAVRRDLSDKDASDAMEWLKGWKESKQKVDIEFTFGTEFRFQNAESSEMQGLIERMHRTISSSMLTLKQANLRLSQITTLVKGMQCMLNKRPLCGMNKENTEEIEFVTPNHLLTGYDLKTCPNYALPVGKQTQIQSRMAIVRYSKHIKSVYSRVWGKFIMTYVEDLNICKRRNQTTSTIKIGDHVIYSGKNQEMSPLNVYQICKVEEVILGRNGDGQIRSLKVKMIKGGKIKTFTRDIRRFSVLELNNAESVPKSGADELSKSS